MAKLKVGMPWEEGVTITPLPDPEHPGRLAALVADALAKGGRVLNPGGGEHAGTLFRPALVYPVAREAEQKGVRLVAEGAPGAAHARARMGGEELKQVLFNLVRNALEALPAGGTIRVGWDVVGARRVRLWVVDDGPGMDAATLARARRPFVTTRAQGTGLGLAIVERLVRDAGGRFELESAPGRGTTARIELRGEESRGDA